MSNEELPARRADIQTSQVYKASKKILGLDLQDLREVVAAAEGIDGGAVVTFEKLSKSVSRVDEYYAYTIHVRDERRTA